MVRIKNAKWLIFIGLLICMLAISLPLSACQPKPAPTPSPTPTPMPTPTGPAPAPAPEVYNWKMQTLQIAADPLHSVYAQGFCDRVKRLSNGQINIELFAVGDIVPMFEMLDGVSKGVIDLSLAYGGWWTGKIGPIAECEVGLPMSFVQPVEIEIYFWDGGMVDIVRKEYAKHGVAYIGPINGGSSSIMLKTPVSKAADLKGVKLMESGVEAKFYEGLGASTVMMAPMGELYTALSTGVVDAVGWAGPRMMIKTLKFHEVAKYVLWPPILETRLQIIMNLDTWNELPDDLKLVLEDSARLFSAEHGAFMYAEDLQTIADARAQYGVNIASIPLEEEMAVAMAIRDDFSKQDAVAAQAIEIENKYLKLFGYLD